MPCEHTPTISMTMNCQSPLAAYFFCSRKTNTIQTNYRTGSSTIYNFITALHHFIHFASDV